MEPPTFSWAVWPWPRANSNFKIKLWFPTNEEFKLSRLCPSRMAGGPMPGTLPSKSCASLLEDKVLAKWSLLHLYHLPQITPKATSRCHPGCTQSSLLEKCGVLPPLVPCSSQLWINLVTHVSRAAIKSSTWDPCHPHQPAVQPARSISPAPQWADTLSHNQDKTLWKQL